MTTRPSSFGASRRRLLAGIGALAAAPFALTMAPATASGAAVPAAAAAAAKKPACLADLVAMGLVTHADFVAS